MLRSTGKSAVLHPMTASYRVGLSLVLIGLVRTLSADQVTLLDGLVLKGQLIAVESGLVTLETDFAGRIDIRQEMVRSINTEDAVNILLTTDEILHGRMTTVAGATIFIATTRKVELRPERIVSLWREGAPSPADRRAAAETPRPRYQWSHELAANFNGRTGTTENQSFSLDFQSTLQGPKDQLVLDLSVTDERSNGAAISDDIKASADYSRSIDEQNNWYTKLLFERDHLKGLDLRRTASLGLSRLLIREQAHNLRLRTGLNAVRETVEAESPNNSFGAEVTLSHTSSFWHASLETHLYYTRAFESPTNDRYHVQTDLDLPLARRNMNLRLGLEYEYSVSPPPDTDPHDLIYTASMVFLWK